MTKTIEDKLTIYGPSICHCGNRNETVFAGERYSLSCRNHPGHPLFSTRGRHEEAGSVNMEDIRMTPTRPTVRV